MAQNGKILTRLKLYQFRIFRDNYMTYIHKMVSMTGCAQLGCKLFMKGS